MADASNEVQMILAQLFHQADARKTAVIDAGDLLVGAFEQAQQQEEGVFSLVL